MKSKLYKILAVFVLLVPLGLLTSNPAWGEWENEYYIKVLGYLPKGMAEASAIKPLLPDYSAQGGNEILWYYISAGIGILLIFLIMYAISKVSKKNVVKS
ncbi:MAG: hypothetical protein R3331_01265 [Sulfurospirillaceae bacterium]|nr:hypothetical protein [Sulfurospirillaceae bacterium]